MLRREGARVPREHLVAQHEHRLERELALALAEGVLEARAEQVDHHRVVVALRAVPVHHGDAACG